MNGSYKNDGFSLIEILVVVVILAIVSTVALMSMGVLGDDRELRTEARRMQTLLEIAQDEAILQGREFGMEIMLDSFRFVEFNPFTDQWSVIVGDDTLRLRQLPEDVEFDLLLEDRTVELELEPAEIKTIEDAADRSREEDYSPHLLIFSSGDMSPFELRITRNYDRAVVVLRRDLIGEFEILSPDD